MSTSSNVLSDTNQIGDFVYTGLPARVVFGTDSLECLADEVSALGCKRVLVLSTPARHNRLP